MALCGKSLRFARLFPGPPVALEGREVKEYLYSLYYNSPTRPVAERTDWINSKVRTGLLVIDEKNRVIVGDHPFVVADLVTDFSVAYDATRDVEVLSYTEPSGTRFDIEGGKVLRNSSPFKVSFELKRQAAADLHTGPLAP
jgi:hypothetical protein